MSSTYDLIGAAYKIAAALIDAEGVADDELLAAIESYGEQAPTKADALGAVLARLDGERAWLREQEQALARRRKSAERGIEHVRGMALALLDVHAELTREGRLRGRTVTLYRVRTQAIEGPDDIAAWPEDLRVTTQRPDKAGAKRRLKAGEPIPGFALVERVSLGVRR